MFWKWNTHQTLPIFTLTNPNIYIFILHERKKERETGKITTHIHPFPSPSNIFHLFHPQCIDPREKFSFKSIAFFAKQSPRQTLFTDTFYPPLTIRAKRNQPHLRHHRHHYHRRNENETLAERNRSWRKIVQLLFAWRSRKILGVAEEPYKTRGGGMIM